MAEPEEQWQQIVRKHDDYEERGGWARPAINVGVSIWCLFVIVMVANWYTSRGPMPDYSGGTALIAFVFNVLLGATSLLLFALTLFRFETLSGRHRVLGLSPLPMTTAITFVIW